MINICFHGIGSPGRSLEPNEEGYWISQDLYRRIIAEVHGREDIAISFDDGNASDIEVGLAPLIDSGRTADFFVLAGRLDRPGSLSGDDVRQLHAEGMRIGSHGMHHIPWRGLTPDVEHQEFVAARDVIAGVIGESVTDAALPLGRYDRRTLSGLRKRGYSRIFSSDRRRARADAWLQPRYSVHAGDTIDSFRAEVLAQPKILQTVVASTKGMIKRWR